MLLGSRPAKEKPRRVILNTDAHNEIDDQMAIVHALLSPELKVEGLIAAHYGEREKDSMEKSYKEILHLLELLDMKGKIPVLKGSPEAMKDPKKPQESEGAKFIIERALEKNEDSPLYIAFLGPLTDMASAYLMEPKISKNIVVLWIGGGWWPTGGPEFNAGNDWISVDVVFQSDIPLIQYPRGTYRQMRVGVAEMERFVMGKGAVGDYLVSLFKTWRINTPKPRTWWVYGDSPTIGTLVNPEWGFYINVPAPRFTEKLEYRHEPTKRTIEVCVEVVAGEIFEDFFKKLDNFAKNHSK